jgi:hypothetical protein
MKKIFLAILAFTVLTFTGCANKTSDPSPSETGSVTPPSVESANSDAGQTVDLTDKNVLYHYVKSELADITQEDFETWEIFYFDITGDGNDEAVLVSTYGANWHEKIEILSADDGKAEPIPCDIYAGKNGTVVDFIDGFMTVVAASGGTGEYFQVLELSAYDGSKMVPVLGGLTVEHQVAAQDTDYTESGDIEGDLTDFTYTLTKTDNIAGKTTVVEKTQYTYDADHMVFDKKTLQTEPSETAPSAGAGEFSFKVTNGSLVVTYGNETRTYIEGGVVYDIVKEGATGQEKLYVLNAYREDDLLYFTVKAPDYSVGEVLYYFDMTTGIIHWVGSETGGAEEGEGVRLTGFTDETIRDMSIYYGDYSAVIIPFYPASGYNYGNLDLMPFIDNPDGYGLDVAIFGTLESVNITRYDDGVAGSYWDLGDLTNTILSIHSNLQSDMSYYEISGVVHVGEGLYEQVSFTVDDMRAPEDYDMIFIY